MKGAKVQPPRRKKGKKGDGYKYTDGHKKKKKSPYADGVASDAGSIGREFDKFL